MLEIPIKPITGDLSFSISLENVYCSFRLMWNTKTEYWMVNTYEEPYNDIRVHGLKIIPNYPFLHTYRPSFPGQIIPLKFGNDTIEEITFKNFGTDWRLIYLTAEEFAEWSSLRGF